MPAMQMQLDSGVQKSTLVAPAGLVLLCVYSLIGGNGPELGLPYEVHAAG